ncbi:MAG: hypothetical protein ABI327_11830 [Burkholderiaceae bacterium]
MHQVEKPNSTHPITRSLYALLAFGGFAGLGLGTGETFKLGQLPDFWAVFKFGSAVYGTYLFG